MWREYFSLTKKIFTAIQHNGIEYGCTLDAVSRTSPFIEEEWKLGNFPELILLVDNFGNLHAPCSVARAFLHEKNFMNIKLVIHDQEGILREVNTSELVPFGPNVEELFSRKKSNL